VESTSGDFFEKKKRLVAITANFRAKIHPPTETQKPVDEKTNHSIKYQLINQTQLNLMHSSSL